MNQDVRPDAVMDAERAYRASMRVYRPLYRTWCLPSQEWQRCQLEKLRAKWVYRGTVGIMRRLAHRIPPSLAGMLQRGGWV